MKRLFFFLTFCAAVLCASASNRYVSPTGDDGDGKSWEHALHSIATALGGRGAGDTVFVAEGVYVENLSIGTGVTLLGGYDAESGVRDPELYESVVDGTGLTSWLLVKYDADPAEPILIDGMVFQNANHSTWGGAAIFMRGNMTVSNCVFRNNTSGSKAGGIYIDPTGSVVPVIRNCLFEGCKSTAAEQAAAIYSEGIALTENCVIRGCQGGVMIRQNEGGTVQNCVIYNNLAEYNGCLYGKGTFINNTVCNNLGVEGRYGGCRIEGKVVNCVFWGNSVPNGDATHHNYIASGTGSSNNKADIGTGMTTGLAADNNAADGPNFRNPTGFAGIAKTDAEKTAVRDADFAVTSASAPLLDCGDATQAPATDMKGVARPKGNGVDLGAYEYDPDAVHIEVTGVRILQDTIRIIVGRTGTLVAQVEPANADNKRVSWSIDDPSVATIQNGKVTALREDTTIAHVETQEGGYTASAVVVVLPVPPVKYPHEVVEADSLYKMGEYAIPSFIEFLVAKEEARIDSLGEDVDLSIIPEKVAAMQAKIALLQPKQQPYNQIATINGDPATHMGFCWFTNGGITEGVVQLLPMANASASDFESNNGVLTLNANTSDANLHYTPIQASESPKYDICTAAGLPRNARQGRNWGFLWICPMFAPR